MAGLIRFQSSATGRDVPVSPTAPLPITGPTAANSTVSGSPFPIAVIDGGSIVRNVNAASAMGDASTGNNALSAAVMVYNGATYDRLKKPRSTARIASSAATTNATVGKASAADLFSVTAYNANAAVRYLKIYNKATAPTVGTDAPTLTLGLPPSASVSFTFDSLYFSAGLSFALTTGAADADATAVGAGDVVALNLAYA